MDFSKPDKNGRVYDPDSVKTPDEYTLPIEVMGAYDKLPEVRKPKSVYVVNDKLYMYNEYGEWCELSTVITENEKAALGLAFEKRIEEEATDDTIEYFSEYHEKKIRDLKYDIKLRLKELKGLI
jgi:hypothetical protein